MRQKKGFRFVLATKSLLSSLHVTAACHAGKFLSSRGQVFFFVSVNLREINIGKGICQPSIHLLIDFNIWHLIILGIKCRQECHATNLILMFPNPADNVQHFILLVRDGDAGIMLCVVDFVLQPEITLLEGGAVVARHGSGR